MLTSAALCGLLAVCLVQASVIDKVKRDVDATPASKCHTVLITPKPDNVACGFQGILEKPAVITSMSYQDSARPFKDCRNKCLGMDDCISFAFDKDNDGCMLYSKHLKSMRIVKKKNDIVHYNHNCFTTTCTTPPPAGPTCGDIAATQTFNLQVVPTGGPYDNYYPALVTSDFGIGADEIILTNSTDDAVTFQFSPYCDLVGYYNSMDPYNAKADDLFAGHILMDDPAYYHKYRNAKDLPPLSCGVKQGQLSCSDPYSGGMEFSVCTLTGHDAAAGLRIADAVRSGCVGLAFTTTHLPPTPT